MKKKIFYAILILALIGGSIGYYMYSKPLASIESMNTEHKLTSEELLQLYEEDEESANAKYLDKVIEVTGIVNKAEKNNGTTSIYLSTLSDFSNVIFQLEEDDPSIKKGDEVTMKGICTGYLMDVVLVRSKRV